MLRDAGKVGKPEQRARCGKSIIMPAMFKGKILNCYYIFIFTKSGCGKI